MNKELMGLKRLRKNSKSSKPEYPCENCKCNRYSPCGCERKAAVPVEVPDTPATEAPAEGTNAG